MPRRPREEVEGGLFHVFARGNNRAAIFTDTIDRRRYLSLLGRTVRQRSWHLLAYCLMPNHVHLLVETPHANLAAGMQRIHSPYAQTFNQRHGRTGGLFEGRYGAIRITTDAYLLMVARYIARNPVEAALAPTPEAYRWSSHREIVGEEDAPPWLDVQRLLHHLSGWHADPLRGYRELVAT